MNTRTILFLVSGLALTQGVIQQTELYSEPNQGETYFVLRDKIPDLKDWKFFLRNVKSFCATGIFVFFTEINYHGSAATHEGTGDGGEERWCGSESDLSIFNSVRFYGPADTRTIAVTIFEGSDSYLDGGSELVVEGRAATNFPMNAAYVVSHGNSYWSLFTEDNFQGTSWCFGSDDGYLIQAFVPNSTHPVRSVIRDCDSQSVRQNILEYQMGLQN